MKKLFVCLGLLVPTGFVFDFLFRAMNQPSDLSYVLGIFGVFGWLCLVTKVLEKTFSKETNNEESAGSPVAQSVNPVDGGMHNENRSGNGGDRS